MREIFFLFIASEYNVNLINYSPNSIGKLLHFLIVLNFSSEFIIIFIKKSNLL